MNDNIDKKISDKVNQILGGVQNVAKTPFHLHNGNDSPQIDISNIARFPSNPNDGDTIIYSSALKQWITSTGSGGNSNGRSHGSNIVVIPSGSGAQITLNANDFANGITWDSTNHQFVIVTAGQYLITGAIIFTNITDGKVYECWIVVNGVVLTQVLNQAGSSVSALSITATDILNLAAGDTVQLYTFQGSGSNQNLGTSGDNTYLSIAKV